MADECRLVSVFCVEALLDVEPISEVMLKYEGDANGTRRT